MQLVEKRNVYVEWNFIICSLHLILLNDRIKEEKDKISNIHGTNYKLILHFGHKTSKEQIIHIESLANLKNNDQIDIK